MSRRKDLEAVATRLSAILGPENCVLIGGLAVGVHGYPRATDDVDFIARIPLTEVRERLERHGIETKLLRGDPLEGDFPCVKGAIAGIRFDVMPPLVPLEWEHSLRVRARGGALSIVDLDGLLRLKLKAQGPQDLLDVARLVILHPESRARARELATSYRVADRLDAFLASPRVQAKAKEVAASEHTPGSRRRRRPRRTPRSR